MDLIAAFQIGYAFRLGYEFARRPHIACLINAKAIANDADFKEGEHPRDKDGKFKSSKSNGDASECIDYEREKYATIASPEFFASIDKKYPAPVITEKLRAVDKVSRKTNLFNCRTNTEGTNFNKSDKN